MLSKSTNNVDELIATESRKDGLKEVSRELFFSDCGEKYLLSEIRPIKVIDGQVAKAIVEELIKGPINASEGLYSVIPKGTQLLDVELIEEGESNIVALYFSKEFKAAFKDPEETPEETENREAMVLSSIVYSLKELPKVKGIKIYYENSYGNYTDIPLHKIDLKKPLNTRDFPGKLGRKLKIYFANTGSTHLVPNYRSMARTTKSNLQIASAIIDELVMGPWASPEQIGVIPPDVEKGDIKVWMDETNARVMVDLPSSKLDESKIGETGSLMALYAMVNSLTDPVNTSNIKEVQFLVDGNVVKDFGNVELSQPFIRNPAIIQK